VGIGLVLQNSAGDNLPIPANATTFTFPTKLVGGAAYDVTVLSRPRTPPRTALSLVAVLAPVAAADVNSVLITCTNGDRVARQAALRLCHEQHRQYRLGLHRRRAYRPVAAERLRLRGCDHRSDLGRGRSLGKFVYVANSQGGSVSAYAISTSGALSAVTGSPFPAGSGPGSITIDHSGRYAYVTNVAGSDITAYSINSLDGALTKIPCSGGPGGGCSTSLNYQIGGVPRSVTVDRRALTSTWRIITEFRL